MFDKLLENDYNDDEQVTLNKTEKYIYMFNLTTPWEFKSNNEKQKRLTHFMPLVFFHKPWKYQKTKWFQKIHKETSGTQWVNWYY